MDTDLVVRAQEGDEYAFARLADGVYGRLQQLSYRILRDPELARESAQQAVLSMWRNLPRLRDPAHFEAWAYRVCVNECHRAYRQGRRSIPEIDSGSLPVPVAPDEYRRIVDRDQLERGFRRLSYDHRVVLVLHHYLGMPMDQIAGMLDVPLGTVKSRMHRALEQMRRALEADAVTRPRPVTYREVTR